MVGVGQSSLSLLLASKSISIHDVSDSGLCGNLRMVRARPCLRLKEIINLIYYNNYYTIDITIPMIIQRLYNYTSITIFFYKTFCNNARIHKIAFFFFFFFNDKGNKELAIHTKNKPKKYKNKSKQTKKQQQKTTKQTNMEGKVRGCHPLMELVWGAGESTKWRCPSTEGWRSAERGGELNRQGDYPDVDQ